MGFFRWLWWVATSIWFVVFYCLLPLLIVAVAVTAFAFSSYMIVKTNEISYFELISAAISVAHGEVLPQKIEGVLFRVVQSSLLLISLCLLARPILTEIYRALTERSVLPLRVDRGPAVLRFMPNFNIGRHASRKLTSLYSKADEIYVIAGDYSWLREHDEGNYIKKTLQLLTATGKAEVLTYKSIERVQAAVGEKIVKEYPEIFKALRSDPRMKFKASFVKRGAHRSFIYLDTSFDGEGVLCTLTESPETHALLDFVESACASPGK